MLKLGFRISERTASRYLPKRPPNPRRQQQWRTFLKNHRAEIAAFDFFTVPTLTFRLLYCLIFVRHDRRQILHFNISEHTGSAWVKQQLREASYEEPLPDFLIFDNDSCFNKEIVSTIKSFGIKTIRTSYHSPWQNGVVERMIGSLRRELLDHVIVFNENHLRRLLRDYLQYYHRDRTHLGLNKDSPIPRPVQARPSLKAKLAAIPRCGGLHHRYEWKEAA